MGVPVYKRILDLFEAEGVNTLFGIPDPNFVHMFTEADARGWSVVAPHHELSAGFMAEAASRMTGKPGLCIGTLGPGCGQHRRRHDVRVGGELAGDLPRRPAGPHHRAPGAPRPHPVRPAGRPLHAVGEVQQLHRVRRPDRRDRPRGDSPRDVRHARSVLHRVPVARDPGRARRCRAAAAPSGYRLVNQGAGAREVAEAVEADPRGQEPDPVGGPRRSHVAHPGGGQGARRADGLPGDPDLRRHVVHPGTGGSHVPLLVLPGRQRGSRGIRPVRRAGYRTR